ncbi:MAG: NUDIX domain-containing protein [Armatimonadota bacterium]
MLLLKRGNREGALYAGMWDAPGGLLEIGEEPEEGARRELREEAGIEVGDLTPCAVVSHLDRARDTQAVTIFHEGVYRSGDVRTDPSEHDEFTWRSPDRALAELTLAFPTHQALSRRAPAAPAR